MITAMEEARCEVSRQGRSLTVEVPGWESRFMPFLDRHPMVRALSDRLEIEVDLQGKATFRWIYFQGLQAILHLAISMLVALEYLAGNSSWTFSQFLLLLGATNFLPYLVWQVNIWQVQHELFQNLRRKLSP